MELLLRDIGSTVCVSDIVFGSVFNKPLVYQVVTSYQSSARQGTHAQKNRSEVSGSGKKPWKQKGTGRARSGSIRSPIWRSGGVTFAAKPRCYRKKVNRKMYRGALKSIFSELVRQNRLITVSTFHFDFPKTKVLIDELKKIDLVHNILIIVHEFDKNLLLASRNLHTVKVCHVNHLNPVILITSDKILITVQSIKSVEGMLI